MGGNKTVVASALVHFMVEIWALKVGEALFKIPFDL